MSRMGKSRQVIWLDYDLLEKVVKVAREANIAINMACVQLIKQALGEARPEKKYACGDCGAEFQVKEELMRHVKEKHPPMLLCPFCFKPNIDINVLRRHVIEEVKKWSLEK